MGRHSEIETERLLQLSQEITRVAASLAELSMGLAAPLEQGPDPLNEPEVATETISWLIKARRERTRFLPAEMFSEPAWDMLLELLAAELGRRRVSVSSLCTAAGIPARTGKRWLQYLEKHGLVVRQTAAHEADNEFVELSLSASNALRRYFRGVVQAAPTDRVAPQRQS